MQKVGLFVTCLVDCLRPEIGTAAVKLLRAAGAEVVYPTTQTCCGQVAFNSGYSPDAARLFEKCAAEFADCNYVVIPSGSCCGMFRTDLMELFETPPPAVTAFQQKCFELGQYLDMAGYHAPAEKAMTVTYHDSCTGLRELGIKNAPRRFLHQNGVSVIEMADCEECCGFGGRFSTQFSALSVALAKRKCDNINAVAADAVVAGDLGCLLHIEGCLRRNGSDLPVLHWAEVLAVPRL